MATARSHDKKPPLQRTTVKFRAVRPEEREDEQVEEEKAAEAIEIERKGGSGEYCFVLPPGERRKKPKR
jgi:hypothetical protein